MALIPDYSESVDERKVFARLWKRFEIGKVAVWRRMVGNRLGVVQTARAQSFKQKAMPFIRGQGLVNLQNFRRILKLVGRNGLGWLGTSPQT